MDRETFLYFTRTMLWRQIKGQIEALAFTILGCSDRESDIRDEISRFIGKMDSLLHD